MKTMITAFVLSISIVVFFSACERNDYQHPAHRSTKSS